MAEEVNVPIGGEIVSFYENGDYRHYIIHYLPQSRSICRKQKKQRTYKMVRFPHLYFYIQIAAFDAKKYLIHFGVWSCNEEAKNLESLTPLNFSNVGAAGGVCLGKNFYGSDEAIIRKAIERFWQTPFDGFVFVDSATPLSRSGRQLTSQGIVVR